MSPASLPLDAAGASPTADFAHPRANRRATLAGCHVAYLLHRSRRRSIGFVVDAEGLSVRAPAWLALRDVDAALAAKVDWIVRKLAEQRHRSQQASAVAFRWGDGVTVPYLGAPLTAACVGGAAAVTRLDRSDPAALRLQLGGLESDARPVDVRDRVRAWLQRDARRVFEERSRALMPRLGVRCTRIGISSARTRWGSASSSGAIRLNWRLIHFALDTIDYVVIHELAHLREMNHGPAFWAIVHDAMPHHADARRALRVAVLPSFDMVETLDARHGARGDETTWAQLS